MLKLHHIRTYYSVILPQIYFEKVYSKHFVEHISYTAKTRYLSRTSIRMCRKIT